MCSRSFTRQAVFPDVSKYHLAFRLTEESHGVLFSDDLDIHLIELSKFTKTPDQLTSALDRWCYFLRHGGELDADNLPSTLDVPEIRQALEVLAMFTKDENEREIYELRLMYQRDHDSLVQWSKDLVKDAQEKAKDAEEKAKDAQEKAKDAQEKAKDAQEKAKDAQEKAKDAEEKAKDAEDRGLMKGTLMGQIHLCQKLLKQPPTHKEELLALAAENLTALLNRLQKQLLPNGD